MAILFKNNASTKLASSITAAATSMTVLADTGALFPAPAGNEYFLCTLVDDIGNKEIVKVTSRTNDTFTIIRAQEGTAAHAFNANSLVENRLTAGALNELLNVTYASAAEVAAGTEAMKAVAPAVLSSANVAHAVSADTAAKASDMVPGHVLAGVTTANALLGKITPEITTPAQFDNSTKIATTAFVKSALGSLVGFKHITASTTLTAADIGYVNNINSSGITATLPDPQPVPAGSCLVFRSGYDSTLAAPTGTYIYAVDGTARTSYTLPAYKTLMLFAAGNAWWAYGGSGIIGGTSIGAALITTVGTTTFTVPAPNLKVTVCGGGAGGCSVVPNNGRSGSAGGTSSFGAYCSATGGTATFGTAGANGGTTGTTIRLFTGYNTAPAQGAKAASGRDGQFGIGGSYRESSVGTAGHGAGFGSGGGGAEYNTAGGSISGGGGAGGAGIAYITGLTVGATVSVTVGGGGAGSNSNNQAIGGNGAQGFVLVEW